jgi:hypothetical protein
MRLAAPCLAMQKDRRGTAFPDYEIVRLPAKLERLPVNLGHICPNRLLRAGDHIDVKGIGEGFSV